MHYCHLNYFKYFVQGISAHVHFFFYFVAIFKRGYGDYTTTFLEKLLPEHFKIKASILFISMILLHFASAYC